MRLVMGDERLDGADDLGVGDMLSDDQDASGPTGGGRAPGLIRLGLLTALITGVLDQANKWWMLTVYDIDQKGQVAVLPFMDLVYVLNRGISYGLFTQSDQRGQYMLAGIAVVVSVGLLIWLMRGEQNRLSAVSIGLIVGGALANAIDRIHLGGVADFYLLHGFGFSWYVFNIADVAIVAGVIGLLIDVFVANRDNASKRSQ
jgi:signal peptidase II